MDRIEEARHLAWLGWSPSEIATKLRVSRLRVWDWLNVSSYDAGVAARARRANPDFDRDPVWLSLRVPGTDA
jgi:hypothetical protein